MFTIFLSNFLVECSDCVIYIQLQLGQVSGVISMARCTESETLRIYSNMLCQKVQMFDLAIREAAPPPNY